MMGAFRLALSLAAPVTPLRRPPDPPQGEPRPSPQSLLELALPLPFAA